MIKEMDRMLGLDKFEIVYKGKHYDNRLAQSIAKNLYYYGVKHNPKIFDIKDLKINRIIY